MPTGMCRICSFGSPHLQLFLRGMDAHPQSDFIGISCSRNPAWMVYHRSRNPTWMIDYHNHNLA
mgnify:CR=1 FL=1